MPEAMRILMMSMLERREVAITLLTGTVARGIVNCIQAEDGSGTSFNVTINNIVCYLKMPIGTGTNRDPIRSNHRALEASKTVETVYGALRKPSHTTVRPYKR